MDHKAPKTRIGGAVEKGISFDILGDILQNGDLAPDFTLLLYDGDDEYEIALSRIALNHRPPRGYHTQCDKRAEHRDLRLRHPSLGQTPEDRRSTIKHSGLYH